jgi:hypothetical protein
MPGATPFFGRAGMTCLETRGMPKTVDLQRKEIDYGLDKRSVVLYI